MEEFEEWSLQLKEENVKNQRPKMGNLLFQRWFMEQAGRAQRGAEEEQNRGGHGTMTPRPRPTGGRSR